MNKLVFSTGSSLTTRLAKALAIAAIILFLISGVDVVTNAAGGQLLGLSTMARGMIFGFGAVALATAVFFVSMRQGSILISILLIVTGTLMAMAIAGVVSTRGLTLIAFPGPIIFLFFGFWIIALGIVKSIITRRNTSTIFSK